MTSSMAELRWSTLVSLAQLPYSCSLKTNENIVKLHALPSTILLSTRIDESIETHLAQQYGTRESGHGDGV